MEINTVLSGKIEYLRLHFYQLCKYIMNSDLLSIKTVEPASINQINNNIANNYIDVIIGNIWEIIYDHYTEIHRYYHTFNHIYDLIKLAKEYEVYIVDKHAVYLSIYFHDIIYNPKSNTNEEDSMKLFQELCSIYINNDILINKVSQYILETKLHNVFDSLDNDLKIFIDLDMSILGCNTTISYLEYAKQIRNEYIHVDHLQYCHGRYNILTSFLMNTKYIFATKVFQDRYENKARENLIKECDILKSEKNILDIIII